MYLINRNTIFKNKFTIFISLLIFNGLLLLIMQALFHIRFEENDDIVMALIGSGGYSGTPDPHLVFINIIYGYIVTFLYSITSGIEWYSVLLLSLHTVSSAIIGTLIIKSDNSLLIKIGFLLLLSAVFCRTSVFLQFTTTASFVALSGVLLILTKDKLKTVIGCFLFILGTLIRFEAAALVLIISSPIFIVPIIKKQNLMPLLYITISGVIAISLKVVDSNYYQKSENWQYYKEYNKLRGQVNDNPNILEWGDKQDQIKNKLILSFLSDPKTIDIDHLNKMIEHSSSKSFFSKTLNIVQLKIYVIPLLLLALFSFILIFRTNSKSLEYIINSLSYFYDLHNRHIY